MTAEEKLTEEPISITVPLSEILEILRLVSAIEMPDVTYSEYMLIMAQQALRLNKMRAGDASNILHKWGSQ